MPPKSNPRLDKTYKGSSTRHPDIEAAKKKGAKDTTFDYDTGMTHWIVQERQKGPMRGNNKKSSGKGEKY